MGVVLLCFVATSPVAAQLIADEPPKAWRGLEIKDKHGSKLPLNLQFTDSSGNKLLLSDVFKPKRPVIFLMVYHRCTLLCPKSMEYLVQSLDKIDFTVGQEYDVVVASFDPRDSTLDAEKAKARAVLLYGRQTSDTIRKGFWFLTSNADVSRQLADALGFPYRYLPESGEYSHGTAIFFVTPEGVVSRCFPKLDFQDRPNDIRLALLEASDGKIGTLLDRFTLWCYHPDDTGKFLISPMRVMQLGGAISGVAVAGLVGGLWIRERRKKSRSTLRPSPGSFEPPSSQSIQGLRLTNRATN